MSIRFLNSNTIYKLIFVAVFMVVGTVAFAQKYAYVDTKYMLDNIPEYKAAQQSLDQLSTQWQKEIEDKEAVIDKLYKAFQSEQILLTDEMKKKRTDEIAAKEKDVKDLQKQRFGYQGDIFKKKQELIKPIQDKIFNAVKTLATDGGYAVIFDKAGSTTMLYTNPKYDKSDQILLSMGYKAGVKPGSAATDTKGTGTGSQQQNSQQHPPR
jgi:outer membrane protein